MCHNGIMTLLLCVVPQCQMLELGEEKKYDYYSGAGITLSFLVCQLLKYKQQLLLNAVGKCLGHKQLVLYSGFCVQSPGGVEESTTGKTLSAAGHKRNAGAETSVSVL